MGTSRRLFIEQRPGLFQIKRIEPLDKPAADRRKKIAGLIPLACPDRARAARCSLRTAVPGLCLRAAESARSKYASALAGSGSGDISPFSASNVD